MCLRNTLTRYGTISQCFHWLLATLIICMLIFGFLLDFIPEAYQGSAYGAHKSIGILILILMLLRAMWALTNIKPAYAATLPKIQQRVAHVIHVLLYLCAIAMPTVGILGSNYAGHPPSFFGLFSLDMGFVKNKPLAEFYFNLHGIFAWALITLIAGHVIAALKHHFIDKDDILRRMLPGK